MTHAEMKIAAMNASYSLHRAHIAIEISYWADNETACRIHFDDAIAKLEKGAAHLGYKLVKVDDES